jgi:hypothetical protein
MPEEKLHNTLYAEILTATRTLLREEINKENVYWISVGLLNDQYKIQWESLIIGNDRNVKDDKGAQIQVKCKEKDGAGELICKPKDNVTGIPPCMPKNIDKKCNFRMNLEELEKGTMMEDSGSIGDLSRKYFASDNVKDSDQPYISLYDINAKYFWIKSKATIVKELDDTTSTSPESEDIHTKLGGKCIPDGATVVLIPLIQLHQNDKEYIGAIGLCAKKGSVAWEDLPNIKAMALSLTNPHSHLYRMTRDNNNTDIKRLINIIFDYQTIGDLDNLNNTLFSQNGECGVDLCSVHDASESKDIHNDDCRLQRSYDEYFNANNITLQKSMYCFGDGGALDGKKVQQSYACDVREVIGFFKKHFHIETRIIDGYTDDNSFWWPTLPGIISCVSLLKLYSALNNLDEGPTAGVTNIKTNKYNLGRDSRQVMFQFVFGLTNTGKGNWKTLAKRYYDDDYKPKGTTTNILKNCVNGDINALLGVQPKQIQEQDKFQSAIMKREETEAPIFYPLFHDDELRLTWIAKTEVRPLSLE